ncbi:type I inositol polyphosphate 5-phosphatase 5 [Spinacia oleracea]|uniref:Type I inositol polyphosphate 5-phosphatase 5 n=1 Tax=Spinacia oleracea TaxID=3562 RepID=A0A9R0K7V5_SPIOL|nr:type I inositol polyphosphate 5-phosphatase 5 [Spinacia oleracea]
MPKTTPAENPSSSPTSSSNDNSFSPADITVKTIKKKKSILPKIFSSKKSCKTSDDVVSESEIDKKLAERRKVFLDDSRLIRKSFSERKSNPRIEGLDLSNFDSTLASVAPVMDRINYRIFVGTWNVGGRNPTNELNLDDFLHVEGSSDIYVIGFQEIVPLNAGNVLVLEDNEPAARWLTLINIALNRINHSSLNSTGDSSPSTKPSKDSSKSNFFQKPNLKLLSKNLRGDSSLVKTCNCCFDSLTLLPETHRPRRIHDNPFQNRYTSSMEEFFSIVPESSAYPGFAEYNLISSKQMVGIFLSIWARKELVPYIGHVRVSSMGTGIMGCLGNKGCTSISMTLHRTSLCFVCSHLASGQKDGDELKRNADVADILKGMQFPKICKNSEKKAPEKIIDHDRVLWFGDLNYRVSLPYEEARLLLEENDWDTLLEKDQLKIERDSGRVFSGWKEGRVMFAPTYKYNQNSDMYAGETTKSKKKRRTPAWCDRILWHGHGIEQLHYARGESRFSDHRPVCAVFSVDVEVRRKISSRFRKGYSSCTAGSRLSDCAPQRHSFYEF